MRARTIAAALLVASIARAQHGVVIGQVTVKEPRAPLGYSAVVTSQTQLLTGESGKFVLRNLAAGTLKITVKHIGFGPRDTVVTLGASDTLRVEVALSRLVIQLPAMLVTAQCTNEAPREEQPAVLAQLFDQVKQNAERYRLMAKAQPFSMRVYRVRGIRGSEGKVIPEIIDTVMRGSLPPAPYEPKRVIRRGIGEFAREWTIAIPELPDLADTAFTYTHCFRYAGQARLGNDSVIRVDYEPVPWLNKEVDISGSLYLRVEDYQLISTNTVLNKVPAQFYGSGITGISIAAKFSEIVPGVPVLDEWYLLSTFRSRNRAPAVETGQIMTVVFDTAAVKPDTTGRRQ